MLSFFTDPVNIVLFVALAPCVFLLYMIYKADKIEKEPTGLLVKLFLYGCLSTFLAMILEILAESLLQSTGMSDTSVLYLLLENFLGVALIEEGSKYIFLRLGTWKRPEFNYVFDGIVYSVFVGLGFAGLENVLYVIELGVGVAPYRAILAIPLHCICAIFMGHYYGLAKYYSTYNNSSVEKSMKRRALLIPILIHGFYDFCLSMDNGYMALVFLVFVIIMDVIAYRSLKQYSSSDRPI